ncbi:MAG: SDR family oxidoreductase [Anaerolineales bacterium]|nr:SDR family oxidoreductase [Anaerolineales bacterium]
MNDLREKTILVTGAARRLGRRFAVACAQAGADVILHHGHSPEAAQSVRDEIAALGRRAWILSADFSQPESAAQLIERAQALSPLYGLVNSAAIFAPLSMQETTLDDWNKHLNVNLAAPFLLSQAFAQSADAQRIVNILDWRALRPGADHFPYAISKAALAALTKSMALALAPKIAVNGLALGAILPPADNPSAQEKIVEAVPAQRWSAAGEVEEALLFLLSGPAYITGEIIHVDGGRHLV